MIAVKRMSALFCVSCLLVSLCQAQSNVAGPSSKVIQQAVQNVEPSIVRIETIGGSTRVDDQVVANQASTGLVISSDGFIVTANFNVAHQPTAIFVSMFDGQRLPAQLVATNQSPVSYTHLTLPTKA